MKKEMVCIVCPIGCRMEVDIERDYKVTGNQCERGPVYAREELTAPKRVVTSTIKISGGLYNRVPIKTRGAIPKELVFKCMEEINKLEVRSPVKMGDVVLEDVLGTGIDIVTTRNM